MPATSMLTIESIQGATCKRRDSKRKRMVMGIGLASVLLVLGSLGAGAQCVCSFLIPGTIKTSDNDVIQFSVKDGEQGSIKFCLSTVGNITWWKGIKIFGNNSWNAIGLLETQDQDHGPSCQTIATGKFQEDASRLEFWKAKSGGAHTDIVHYTFSPSKYDGKVLDFLWQKD